MMPAAAKLEETHLQTPPRIAVSLPLELGPNLAQISPFGWQSGVREFEEGRGGSEKLIARRGKSLTWLPKQKRSS